MGKQIKPLYVQYVEILNKVAKSNDYADASEMWLTSYTEVKALNYRKRGKIKVITVKMKQTQRHLLSSLIKVQEVTVRLRENVKSIRASQFRNMNENLMANFQ